MRKDGTMTINESIRQHIRSMKMLKLCKLLIGAVSVMHLILANIHVAGLLKLENEICGFVMFVSVIFGLVCFFQSSRTKFNNLRELIPMMVFFAITIISLVLLAFIYSDAINNQVSLKSPDDVIKALNLTICMIVLYLICAVLMLADYLKNGRKHNKEAGEDE